ncbi:hypothetical protein GCM10010909_24510 [Acidocella aquatica]|uniref:Uncharacterized protein n=1 Tax=Acidocella aquatica TaxID=1922313 RepID=A0ABQ6A8X5_9PROT|nr:hypothetical protein [Acidocella aquatica]GLR67770.1 hypothetical protein GCM10010909_24510 [Acidocella aquatica]
MNGLALSESDLRAMIRDILREVAGKKPASSAPAPQPVRIATDADLQGFIARLASPGTIEAIRAGALRFTLACGPASREIPPPAQAPLEGVVSERRLTGLAAGAHVILAPGAVLTPLAKDFARRMSLRFERRG